MLSSKFSVSKWLFDNRSAVFATVLLMAVLCVPMAAFANQDSVVWNTGLEKLINALSGKTALMISMLGLFAAGGILIFGGQLGSFGRSLMMIILVGSILGALSSVVKFFIKADGMLLF